MTTVTKTSAKQYFVTGAFPTQGNFGDFIDSCIFAAETSAQSIATLNVTTLLSAAAANITTVSANNLVTTTSTVLKGTATNDSAAAGNIGEYLSSFVTTSNMVSVSGSIQGNVTTLSLTAGDWDVGSQLSVAVSAGKTISLLYSGISTTTGSINSNAFGFSAWLGTFAGDDSSTLSLNGATRVSLASTTTVYLVAQHNVAPSQNFWGGIWARRRR